MEVQNSFDFQDEEKIKWRNNFVSARRLSEHNAKKVKFQFRASI